MDLKNIFSKNEEKRNNNEKKSDIKKYDEKRIEDKDINFNGTNRAEERVIFKETVKEKLYILLIESSTDTKKYFNDIKLIYDSIPINSLVCVISYSDKIVNSKIKINSTKLKDEYILSLNFNSARKRLYDALDVLCREINENAFKVVDADERHNYVLGNIEIIGIGTGLDNTKHLKDNCFLKVSKDIKTKYCALCEENIQDIARLGFRTVTIMSVKKF